MSTTLSDAPTFSGSPAGVSPRVRLPGEDDHIEAEPSDTPVPDADGRRVEPSRPGSRKTALLSISAMVFLIGSAGVISYMRRAEFEHIPTIHRALVAPHISGVTHPAGAVVESRGVTAHTHAPAPVAAATTHIQVPQKGPALANAKPTTPPVPAHTRTPQAAPQHATVTSASANETSVPSAARAPATVGDANAEQAQLAQFEALKPHASTSAVPHSEATRAIGPGASLTTSPTKAASASPSSSAGPQAFSAAPTEKVATTASPSPVAVNGQAVKAPGHPPSTAAPQVKDAAPSSATAPGKAPPLPAPAKPAPVTRVANPEAQAVALKAAPMSSEQQLDVLHLVTELGVLVRDQRTEIASLRERVAQVSGRVKGELTDFDRRLSIAEADGAISAAMGAGKTLPEQKSATSLAEPPAPAAKKVTEASPPPLVRHVSDYHIQAASPGLAMLTTTIDGGSRITVGVGDEVPGIGRVEAVLQRGTRWVVETDHGVIKQ